MTSITSVTRTWLSGGDPSHIHPHEKLCEGDRGKEGSNFLVLKCQSMQTVEGMNG